MLGHALYRTGLLGFPLEYANSRNLAEWKQRLAKDSLHEVMDEIQKRRTSPNGVFSIKIHYGQIAQFGGFGNLVRMFPDSYYVLLTRSDVLRQAVSLSMARQTGVWMSGQGGKGEDARYDFAEIDECLRRTILHNSSWRYKLAATGCRYIEMDFDQVRDDLACAIHRIAEFIGITMPAQNIPSEQVTRQQGSNTNDEWANRFRSEFDEFRELLPRARPGLLGRLWRRLSGLDRNSPVRRRR